MLTLLVLIFGLASSAWAIDPACTTTPNLLMKRCPATSIDWYDSYTDIVDSLDDLAKTASSSFTVVGAFQANGSTFTVSSGGIITAPSQPSASAQLSIDQSIPNNAVVEIYWNSTNYNQQNMWVATASSTIKIPASGAGIYDVRCQLGWLANATGRRQTYIILNGSNNSYAETQGSAAGTAVTVPVSRILSLAAGDLLKCGAFQTTGGAFNMSAGNNSTYFSVVKLW